MRKNQPRNYLKLSFLLFGMCIFITSCQKDDYDRNPESETFVDGKLHLKIKSYGEMTYDTKFNGALDKISRLSNPKNKGNFLSKTVMEEQYGFLIDSSTIKQVDIGNFTSYTMLIAREIDSTSFFENLVVQIDSLARPQRWCMAVMNFMKSCAMVAPMATAMAPITLRAMTAHSITMDALE